MAVDGQLTTMIVVLGGAGILLAGFLTISYVLRSPQSTGQPTGSSGPTSSSPSTESNETTKSEQPSEPAGSAKQETTSTSSDATDHPDPTAAEADSTSSTADNPGEGPTQPQTGPRQVIQENNAQTGSTQTTKTVGVRNRRANRVTRTPSQTESPPPTSDNTYFKQVDADGAWRWVDVDTTASYLDVDYGPEVLDLGLMPDLIEVDLGPSVLNQGLVQSPIEFKISSFLRAILTPPRGTGADPANETGEPAGTDNSAHDQTGEVYGRRRGTGRSTHESAFRGDNRSSHQATEVVDPIGSDNEPLWNQPEPPLDGQQELGSYTVDSLDAVGLDGSETPLIGGSDQSLFPEMESLPVEDPIFSQEDMVVEDRAFEPVHNADEERYTPFDIDPEYSLLYFGEPQQDDIGPFAQSDLDSVFSQPMELEEHLGELFSMSPDEESGFGGERFDWEPDDPILEPMMETGCDEAIWGFDPAEEESDWSEGLPGLTAEDASNQWPSVPTIFSDGDGEEDWWSF